MNGRELKMLTKPELEAIRERVEKATPGDWHTTGYFLNRETNRLDLTSVWGPIDHAAGHQSGKQITKGGAVTREDGEFIAKAKTDIPALLQHIEVLSRLLRTAQHSLVALDSFVATDRPDLVHMPEDLSMKINNGVEVLAINRVLGDSYPEAFTQDELLQLGREE